MRVLYITGEWPTAEHFWAAPFLVRQVSYLRQAGLDIDVFSYRGNRRLSRYVTIYQDLQEKLRSQPYDLVHAHFGHSGLLAALPKRLPLVVTFHGSDLQGFYTRSRRYHPITYPYRLAMQFVAYRADEVVLVAAHMGRFLLRKDTHVIPGGIDLKIFKPMPQAEARHQLGLSQEKRIVIFVGSPNNPVKRHHLAEAAVAALKPDLDTKFITLTGVAPEQMPRYMNAADALLVTSRHEGSPTVVKEAIACNLPIVTLDVGDVQERLKDVIGCAIVPSDEPQAIAAALETILRRKARTNGWSAAQELDEMCQVNRQIAVYEAALKRASLKRY